MPQSPPPLRRIDGPILLLLASLLLFLSPFTSWWAQAPVPWYFPFVLWGLLIGAIFLYQRSRQQDDD